MAEEENEASARPELTPEEQARRDAALAQIVQLGDPVLRTTAAEITVFDDELMSFAAHMVALMDDAIGVGLAAPQVGRPIRMFVYREDGDGPARAIINPVIEPITEVLETEDEGCLSLVGLYMPVERPAAVRLRGKDAAGRDVDERLDGFTARIVQHENDHLDGVLILERTTPEWRRAALKALQSGEPMIRPDGATAEGEGPAGAGDPSASAEPAADRA
ncbi:MAG: peptide deformylase [Solirubrobacteraceae bacterium]|nr:peptide deformylase [Patulibacter sp.]